MGTKKAKPSKSKAKPSGASRIVSAVSGAIGGKSKGAGGHGRRKHGVTYWQNKVLVEKLKKKFGKIKYGSVR
jgi:hypothetical protein